MAISSNLQRAIQGIASNTKQVCNLAWDAEKWLRFFVANGLATELAGDESATDDDVLISTPITITRGQFKSMLAGAATFAYLARNAMDANGKTLIGSDGLTPAQMAELVVKVGG